MAGVASAFALGMIRHAYMVVTSSQSVECALDHSSPYIYENVQRDTIPKGTWIEALEIQ